MKLFAFALAFASLNASATVSAVDVMCNGTQAVQGGLGKDNNVSVVIQRNFPGGGLTMSIDNNGTLLMDNVAVKYDDGGYNSDAESYSNGNGNTLILKRKHVGFETSVIPSLYVNGNLIQDLRLSCKQY